MLLVRVPMMRAAVRRSIGAIFRLSYQKQQCNDNERLSSFLQLKHVFFVVRVLLDGFSDFSTSFQCRVWHARSSLQ